MNESEIAVILGPLRQAEESRSMSASSAACTSSSSAGLTAWRFLSSSPDGPFCKGPRPIKFEGRNWITRFDRGTFSDF
jgi:hypothetical protein